MNTTQGQSARTANVVRRTAETDIEVRVDVDGTGKTALAKAFKTVCAW